MAKRGTKKAQHSGTPARQPEPEARESAAVPKAPPDGPDMRQSDVRDAFRAEALPDEEGETTHERPKALTPPSPDRVLLSVLELTRAVNLEMHDEEIVDDYVTTLGGLFPNRRFAIRLLSRGGALSLVHASGKLLPERREQVEIGRESLARHGILPEQLTSPSLRIVAERPPLFHAEGSGFDVPMMDGADLIGVLSVEYPPAASEPEGERPIIVQLGLQLAAALRNARLLRESRYLRDYLGKLLDHASAPIIVIGRHREIRVVNRAFLAMTGRRSEELLGTDFLEIIPQRDRAQLTPIFLNALRGDPTASYEMRLPRATGGHARVVLNTASIMGADGQVEAVIAIGQDLTEIRRLQSQVIQAEKLATLGQLAAGVVHELNNPLTSISVYSDYLMKKCERPVMTDEGDVEKLRRISQGADRMLRFTRDLVTYARPSNEEPQLVSIHDVLEQALVFCEHIISEAGVDITKRYANELPQVYAVKGQLHQIFINLITNACHAMPQGAGRLELETCMSIERLAIRLKDNGAGITPDHLDRVFEPFFSTKREGKGTGLGLSIVRNIVERHAGEVRVSSELGGGTTFEVRLPVR